MAGKEGIPSRLFSATTAGQVSSVIWQLEKEGYKWVPVGGVPNNSGAIEIGSDPAESLTERVTNAIDAVLEREWQEHHRSEPKPATPREAAEKWFEIPKGLLANLPVADRRKLAESIRVTLMESNVEHSPTVLVEDRGIGQNPKNFATTLLSLHWGNKIDKHFLMGAYGQGGAAVYAFSEYTVVISRRVPSLLDEEQRDLVGWTIVRYNPLDNEHKNGRYEYLVTAENEVPSFDPGSTRKEFQPGTQIKMVQYQLPKHSTIFTALRYSLWQLANMVLYDPVLPFIIGDERIKRFKGLRDKTAVQRTRVIIGNTNLLRQRAQDKPADEEVGESEEARTDARGTQIRHDQEYKIDLRENGTVAIRYWIFDFPKNKSKTAPVDAFSDAQCAIAVTLNGQRQAKFDRAYFRNNLNLPILKDYMLIQIDCDRLSKSGKKALFSATRDRIRQTEFLDDLLEEMDEKISHDPHVRAIAESLQEAALKSASSAENIRLSRQLEELIKEWEIKGTSKEIGRQMLADESGQLTSLTLKRKPVASEKESDEEEADGPRPVPPRAWVGQYFPSLLDFASLSNPLRFPLGKRHTIILQTDAQDDCLTREKDRGELRVSIEPLGAILVRSTGLMRSGLVPIGMMSAETTTDEDRAKIVATLSFQDRPQLVASRNVVFLRTRKGSRKPVEIEGAPRYKIVPVKRENDQWITDEEGQQLHGLAHWAPESVAEVDPSSKTTILIYVNMSNPDFVQAIRRRSVGGETIRRYRDRYMVAIAFHTYIQDRSVTELVAEKKPVPSEEALEGELRRIVRTVIYTTFVAPEQEVFVEARGSTLPG